MFYCPDITTNLKNKNFSIHEVEDWKVTIPSYDIFPTVPLTFDKVFWEAYWPIVNEPVLAVRNAMMKLEKERKENEMKKMSEMHLFFPPESYLDKLGSPLGHSRRY